MKLTEVIKNSTGYSAVICRSQREEIGGNAQKDFEIVIDAIATIRTRKLHQYGPSRMELSKHTNFELVMMFSDIHRKYIRLRNQMTKAWDEGTYSEYLETLADLAAYAIQGVQIVWMLSEKRTSPDDKPTK